MPKFQFELPPEDYDYIQGLSNQLGVTPSEALHDLLLHAKGRLSDDAVTALAEQAISKEAECVVPDHAYWERLPSHVRESAQASATQSSKAG